MTYELWDTDSANLVGAYGTEAEALHIVRQTLAAAGEGRVLTWALAREENNGETTLLAAGTALVQRAGHAHRTATG